jgi:hypothetical protein
LKKQLKVEDWITAVQRDLNTEHYRTNCFGVSCYKENLFFNSLLSYSLHSSNLLLRYPDLHASVKSETELIPHLEEESSEGTCMVRKVTLSICYSKPVTGAITNTSSVMMYILK